MRLISGLAQFYMANAWLASGKNLMIVGLCLYAVDVISISTSTTNLSGGNFIIAQIH